MSAAAMQTVGPTAVLATVPASVSARLAAARRVVIKVGTNVLLRPDGCLALGALYGLVEAIATLRRAGRHVLLVSSGAVGFGSERLGERLQADDALLEALPAALPMTASLPSPALTRAYAAVGQGRLMALYEHGFARLGLVAAQVLVTNDDLAVPARRRQLRATIETLFQAGAVPILNENDAVPAFDILPDEPNAATARSREFSDNDMLAALAASAIEAEVLLLLTDVDGLYTANPARTTEATLLTTIHAITPDVLAAADGQGRRGRGGMAGKLAAAQAALAAGILTIVANGRRVDVASLLAGTTVTGTIFLPPGFETETSA